jgi:hypothetical protein
VLVRIVRLGPAINVFHAKLASLPREHCCQWLAAALGLGPLRNTDSKANGFLVEVMSGIVGLQESLTARS